MSCTRMKTPEMLYQQLDRITDCRFCKRNEYTAEERAMIVGWAQKLQAIVERYIANIYAIAGVEDKRKCDDVNRCNDIFYHYYVSTEEYMNYKRG